jgi:Fe-S-cluster containining protein
VQDTGSSDDPDLAAGDFAAWLAGMQAALRHERDSEVPCNGCTACCTSSQFIHIAPDEVDTVAHIPAALLFPAPRMPQGNFVVGYDDRGHCPMLIDGACSIYEHRPRTCRTYDCRVFPAAGVEIDDADKAEIAERTRRWRFSHPTTADAMRHDAVRAAGAFLREQGGASATQLAVRAVEVHEQFLAGCATRDDAT